MSGERKGAAYTYILRCSDGTLYTGWTNDLKKRLEAHNTGKGAKYTRHRIPVELVYCEVFGRKEEAMSREVKIKQMTRLQKLELIKAYSAEAGGFLLCEGGSSHEGKETHAEQ